MWWHLAYFAPIHLKWKTIYLIIPSADLLRLSQMPVMIPLKWPRSRFDPFWIWTCAIQLLYQQLCLLCWTIWGPHWMSQLQGSKYSTNGKLRKHFNYLPVIIPWLKAMLANSAHATKMCYRAEYMHEPGFFKDIFDGSHYQSLLNTTVPTDGAHPFFFLFWWMWHCPWPFNRWFCSIQETWCDSSDHYPF